jgi:hypothetical protein
MLHGVQVFRLMHILGLDKSKAASARGKDDLDSGAALLVITRDSELCVLESPKLFQSGDGPFASSRKLLSVPMLP